MIQKITLFLTLTSCIILNVYARDIPNPFDIIKQEEEKKQPKPPKEPKLKEEIKTPKNDEVEEVEFSPFIETGNIVLPISPEVLEAMAEKETPAEIVESPKEEVKEEIEEEEEIEKTYDKPEIIEEKENIAEPEEDKAPIAEKKIEEVTSSLKKIETPKPIVKEEKISPKAAPQTKMRPNKAEAAKKAKLQKFIKDEAILILFKDDDVILGKLTKKAKLDQMSFAHYLKLYEDNNKKIKDQKANHKTKEFIAKYPEVFVPLSRKHLQKEIKEGIGSSNLDHLRIFVDNYDILNMQDQSGNNMLHLASINNDLIIAKWLVMRGIKLNQLNQDHLAPIDLALIHKNWAIFNLLDKAGAK